MFLVDLEEGRIVDDEELKHSIATAKPYGKWLARVHGPAGRAARGARTSPGPDHETLLHRQQAFGYTLEDLKYILGPMGNNGEEAIGSMGTDTPLAVLSDRAQPLFNYFKQLFAQVTNPPLDAIREELVTSVLTGAGGEGNLLDAHARRAAARSRSTCRSSTTTSWPGSSSSTAGAGSSRPSCRCSSPPPRGPRGWSGRSRRSSATAVAAIEAGANLLILSDRGVDATHRADPVAAGLRRAASSPGPRGDADPRRAGDRVRRRPRSAPLRPPARLRRRVDQPLRGVRDARRHDQAGADQARDRPRRGGLPLPQGDQEGGGQGDVQDGHQHHPELPRRPDLRGDRARTRSSSTSTSTRRRRGSAASAWRRSPRRRSTTTAAPTPTARPARRCSRRAGQYQWRRDGEYHLFNPETVFRLQHATQSGRYDIFKKYTTLRRRAERAALHPPRAVRVQVEPVHAGADRGGRAGRVDRQAVRHRRDVLRLDQRRGARDAGHRHEPDRRPRATPAKGARTPPGSSRCPTATASGARSSRSPRAGSA